MSYLQYLYSLKLVMSEKRSISKPGPKPKLLKWSKYTVSAPMQPRGSIFQNSFLGEVLFKFDAHFVLDMRAVSRFQNFYFCIPNFMTPSLSDLEFQALLNLW